MEIDQDGFPRELFDIVIEATLEYFAEPGPTTDLSDYSDLIHDLPSDPIVLARIVRGLLIHEGVVAQRGLQFSPERFADRKRVGAASILGRVVGLDAAPLTAERPVHLRMIGYCYHFAILHCAFLRANGVPARARCGFAAYFRDDACIDHWVVEYWNGSNWVLIDPDAGRDVVSANDFHHAGRAWSFFREGNGDPSRHGNHVLWGWDELRGSLVNDIGALNKVEVGEWRSWCNRIDVEHRDRPNATLDVHLDSLASMASSDGRFEELQRAYQLDPGLHPPLPNFG